MVSKVCMVNNVVGWGSSDRSNQKGVGVSKRNMGLRDWFSFWLFCRFSSFAVDWVRIWVGEVECQGELVEVGPFSRLWLHRAWAGGWGGGRCWGRHLGVNLESQTAWRTRSKQWRRKAWTRRGRGGGGSLDQDYCILSKTMHWQK